ncbi:MAG: response regulator [Candidatus Hydrogenedentes bacterium]|nr:response regulator [Candidatus Hydrogenedentota bacterium]
MKRELLIVDDEEEIRGMLDRHFRLLGYDVELAANGKEALRVLQRRAIRVVISDILMPEMDGIELLSEVRAQYPMTRVIMITGYVTIDNVLACMRKQADTCIFKPLSDLGELDSAVEMAFEHLEHWERKLLELQGMKTASNLV